MPADRPRLVTIRSVDLAAGRDRADVGRLLQAYIDSMHDDVCVGAYAEERTALQRLYASPGGLWLAMVDGRACGMVGLRDLGNGTAELRRLYVDPGSRGLGIGGGLVDALLEQARAGNIHEVTLDTRPFMAAARALYTERGFTVVHDPAASGDPETADPTRRISMRLRL